MKFSRRNLIAAAVAVLCMVPLSVHEADGQIPTPLQGVDRGVSSQYKKEAKSQVAKKSHQRLPEIDLSMASDLTWREVFDLYSTEIFEDYSSEKPVVYETPDADFAKELGFNVDKNGRLTATQNAIQNVASYSRDTALTELLGLYSEYLTASNASRESLLTDAINALFENPEITYEQKIGIYLTLEPWLIQHALDSKSVITVRKLRETARSMERLWPNMEVAVQCVKGNSEYRFSLDSLKPGAEMKGGMLPFITESAPNTVSETVSADESVQSAQTAEISQDSIDALLAAAAEIENAPQRKNAQMPEIPESAAAPVMIAENTTPACGIIPARKPKTDLVAQVQNSMNEAIWALTTKDGDFTMDSMERLFGSLDALNAKYGLNASWNDHWDNAPAAEWACNLHTIELSLLEHDRYIELMRLNRTINQLFTGSNYYYRLTQHEACHALLKGNFQTVQTRLESEYAAEYDWIVQNFSPKNEKKLDKAFASWTKKGKAPAKHHKRLMAFWAAWSMGNYERASRYAGDVIEKRARIAHPQLHSLNLLLSAYRGESWSRDDLDTYIRVLRLKFPALPYQALTESYAWMNQDMKKIAAAAMREYTPAYAPHAAAEFFRTYGAEMRKGMNSAHLAQIDAWLETELRNSESAPEANRRRLSWFRDLYDASDWSGMEKLASIAAADSSSESWATFWIQVGYNAKSVVNHEKSSEHLSTDSWFSDCDMEHPASGDQWLKAAYRCIR